MSPAPAAANVTIACWFASSKEIEEVAFPVTVGWNATLKEALCPAASTRGSVTPVTWKTALVP